MEQTHILTPGLDQRGPTPETDWFKLAMPCYLDDVLRFGQTATGVFERGTWTLNDAGTELTLIREGGGQAGKLGG